MPAATLKLRYHNI